MPSDLRVVFDTNTESSTQKTSRMGTWKSGLAGRRCRRSETGRVDGRTGVGNYGELKTAGTLPAADGRVEAEVGGGPVTQGRGSVGARRDRGAQVIDDRRTFPFQVFCVIIITQGTG